MEENQKLIRREALTSKSFSITCLFLAEMKVEEKVYENIWVSTLSRTSNTRAGFDQVGFERRMKNGISANLSHSAPSRLYHGGLAKHNGACMPLNMDEAS